MHKNKFDDKLEIFKKSSSKNLTLTINSFLQVKNLQINLDYLREIVNQDSTEALERELEKLINNAIDHMTLELLFNSEKKLEAAEFWSEVLKIHSGADEDENANYPTQPKNRRQMIFLSHEDSRKLEQNFNFGAEESADFEDWLDTFILSLPDHYQGQDYVELFLTQVYKLEEVELKRRLKQNEYFTYEETIPKEKKQLLVQ